MMHITSPTVAGLELWRVLFSRGGETGFLELFNDAGGEYSSFHQLKTVSFLVLNCLVSVS